MCNVMKHKNVGVQRMYNYHQGNRWKTSGIFVKVLCFDMKPQAHLVFWIFIWSIKYANISHIFKVKSN